jgi:hypothetical protein
LAGVHVGDADARPEGGADRLAGDDGAGAGDLRAGDVVLRAGVVQLDLGDGAALGHALHSGEHRAGEVGLCLERLQLGFLHRDVERDEDGAGVDDASGRERDAADGAGQLVAQRDRAQGEHGADRGGGPAVLALGRAGGTHGLDGLRLARGRGVRFARFGELPCGERSAHGGDRGEKEEGPEPDTRDRDEAVEEW